MKQSSVTASALMQDDHFEMAGEMYRVDAVRKDSFDNRTIVAFPVNGDPILRIEVTVAYDTPFKIYNQ